MFNQSGRNAFSPSNQPRRLPGQPGSTSSASNSFSAQIRPDFIKPSGQSGTQPGSSTHMARIKPDDFQRMNPATQRAALFDQARQQATQARQISYGTLRNPSSALPGGLSEKQRMDFAMLQRTDPLAAQKQLQQYQRTSDIRYNKPGTTPQPRTGSGLTYRRPPSNPSGPRRTFGS